MATIHIDDSRYEVGEGRNLLTVALSLGLDLPYFCWHPALGSVGACRQCAVVQYKDAEDDRGKLTMACMTPVADGGRYALQAPLAREFRAGVIEWLMTSHPHDCPVCEEGGECHLQDMTLMTGHVRRRYRGRKRTWRNQYLGPFINHEMNRCITCYRCVRFYRDYAGGDDLEDFGSRDRVYFGRATDGVLASEFSGNLVEVCPTGVFTDKPFARDYVRKWDLASAPSICAGCSLGCNTLPGVRGGRLRRVMNRYHGGVNGYFICDRGRFGAGWVNGGDRLRRVGVRRDDGVFAETAEADGLAMAAEAFGGDTVIGIGSPRASLETNFALAELVGHENFCPGFAADEAPLVARIMAALGDGRGRVPALREVEQADAVLVLGEDPADTAPRLALALRQAAQARRFDLAAGVGIQPWQDAGARNHAQGARYPVSLATVLPSRSAEFASEILTASPPALAEIGRSIAAAVRAGAESDEQTEGGPRRDPFVEHTARALLAAERPLVVSGTGSGDAGVIDAAAEVVAALADAGRDPSQFYVAAEADAFGAALLGGGRSLDDVLAALERGAVSGLIVAENDLMRRADPARVEAALARAGRVVVLDAVETATAAAAHVVLPTAPVTESSGTFVNSEGRAQRFQAMQHPEPPVYPAWQWLADLAAELGRPGCDWRLRDQVTAACAARYPQLAGIEAAAPGAAWRSPAGLPVAREPRRASGRTARHAHRSIHEPRTPRPVEAPLSWSMEGINRPGQPSALITYYWAPGWSSNEAMHRYQQEVAGTLRGGEPGVRLSFPATVAAGLSAAAAAGSSRADSGRWRLFPVHHVFGSDELSARAPALAERIPVPSLALHPRDAAEAGLDVTGGVRLRVDGRDRGVYAVRPEASLERGWVGVPRGLPGSPGTLPRGEVTLEAVADFTPVPADGLIARG